MHNKPIVFFAGLMLMALILIVAFQMGTNPFGDVEVHKHEEPGEHAGMGGFAEVISLYGDLCAACHGTVGEGVGRNPALRNTTMTVDEIKTIIRSGKGDMPAFPDLKGEQLDRMARLIKRF